MTITKKVMNGTIYFLYNRKSTIDERQLLSLESQEEAMKDIAQRENLSIGDTFKESRSAKEPNKRPVFNEMISRIKAGEANGILCWELSRLARNPDEAGLIIGMLQRGEIKHIKTFNKDYLSNDNSVISFVEFGIANQFSRDLSKNVKRGTDKKVKLGWRPNLAPLGYLNSKTKAKGEQDIYNDPIRFEMVKKVFRTMLTGNYTTPKLLDYVNDELCLRLSATKKRPERKLRIGHLYRILTNSFYYGWYAWPVGSDNWVKGNQEAMITEAEFDRVQFLLGRKGRPRPKSHKFAFTGIMKCPCGASITAEEKFKKQKNGNSHHYIYYRCTRKVNPNCIEKAIEIKDLNTQIDDILQKLTISERFQKWALHYLHQTRKTEAITREQSISAKNREYERTTTQLDNLVLKYTSPDNENGRILSDEEYVPLRSRLLKIKDGLAIELATQDKQIGEWVELSERTFNFARYGKTWFSEGSLETKRAVFSCLGSDFLLKDQKVAITMRKPFSFIFEGLSNVETELERLEPLKNEMNTRDIEVFAQQFPLLSGIRESNPSLDMFG